MKSQALPVYLYLPNVVGYFRLTFLFTGLFVVQQAPVYGALCFICNLVLDALDGHLARMLNQVSSFGAIFDYTIDRISFASYALLLTTVYPEYSLFLIMALNLDLASHFFHLNLCYVLHKLSHKDVSSNDPLILRLYYKKLVLGAVCLSHDLFFISLYLYYFYPSHGLRVCLGITLLGVLFKVSVHLTQIAHATKNLLTIKKNL